MIRALVTRFGSPRFAEGLVRRAAVILILVAGCSDREQEALAANAGENQGPGATETNFFSIPCDEDSDCAEGLRCEQLEAPDGGLALGRCVRPRN